MFDMLTRGACFVAGVGLGAALLWWAGVLYVEAPPWLRPCLFWLAAGSSVGVAGFVGWIALIAVVMAGGD